MKKLLVLSACVTIMLATSCVKDYECHCTYVANALGPSVGQPNKDEHSTVEARTIEDARTECSMQEGKYTSQFFSGTCNVD